MTINDKIKKLGSSVGFSLARYDNPTDRGNTDKARRVTSAFLEGFASFLDENDMEMTAGFDEFESLGAASYLAVKPKHENVLLMMALVPHDVIDINEEEDDE